MKKLFAIMAIAAAMMVAFCFQSAASCPVNDQAVQSANDNADVQMATATQTPILTITGGAFPARGRWQVRVTVYNPSGQTVLCYNIGVIYTDPASGQEYRTGTTYAPLASGESQELFLDFEKLPGGLKAGDRCKLIAYADCPTLSVSILSAPYYAILR